MTLYVITRQTTQSGTATNVISVNGTDFDEALLNAKIKAYKTMESFKNEKTMVNAFVGVSDLDKFGFYIAERWEKPIEPTAETE